LQKPSYNYWNCTCWIGFKAKDARLRRHKLYPATAAGAGFTIYVYTKSATSPSRKIFWAVAPTE
jgi:hypothetical protein